MRLGLAVLACAVLTVAAPVAALAQAGFYLTPSLRLSEEFDDNVFVTSSGQRSDFITRFTPGVEVGYRSEPFTLLARSSFDDGPDIHHNLVTLSLEAAYPIRVFP